MLGVCVMITFGSTIVQRLNIGERNSPSLVQRSPIDGFLGRLGKGSQAVSLETLGAVDGEVPMIYNYRR